MTTDTTMTEVDTSRWHFTERDDEEIKGGGTIYTDSGLRVVEVFPLERLRAMELMNAANRCDELERLSGALKQAGYDYLSAVEKAVGEAEADASNGCKTCKIIGSTFEAETKLNEALEALTAYQRKGE